MRVRSPIGDLPFTVTGFSRGENGAIVVEGELGAWESQVEVGLGDVPMLARALRGPLVAAALVAAAAVIATRRG
jgi:hypothetical protein